MKQKFLLKDLAGKQLCILLLALCSTISAFSQSITVKGTVISSGDGLPLVGASVHIKGSTAGAITDVEGLFTIAAATGDILQVSYIGYLSQDVTVTSGTTSLKIILKASSNTLEEVVLVGYGTQKRASLTASVSSVTAKQLENQIQKNFMDGLSGQVAGVQVTSSTGRPGAASVVRIRGTGSIQASNVPLYVVDGQAYDGAGDINMINPDDIERVDILKDASATAIYGSRGSNGVVLVTTKKGKAGQSKIEFSAYTGFQDVPKRIKVLNTAEEAQYWKEVTAANWAIVGGDPNIANGSRIFGGTKNSYDYPVGYDNPSALPNTDWQSLVLSNSAPISNYNVSAQGGTDKSRYFLSGNYLSQDGVVKSTGMKRYTARINADANVSKYVRIGTSIAPSYSYENVRNTDMHVNSPAPDIDASLILGAIVQPSSLIAKNDAGLYGGNGGNSNVEYSADGWAGANNPLQVIENKDYKKAYEKFVVKGVTYLEIEPIKNLVFHTDFDLSFSQRWDNTYRPSTVPTAAINPPVGMLYNPSFVSNPLNILAYHDEYRSINYTWNNNVTWNKTFNHVHDISILAGYAYQQQIDENSGIQGTQGTFPNDAVEYVTGSTTVVAAPSNSNQAGIGKSKWNLISYLARANYAYENKYLFTGVVREDGSSRFGANVKFAVFPSASVAWVISQEDFLKSFTMLSNLKLRLGLGKSGNFSIGNYAPISLLTNDNYTFGNTLAAGSAIQTPANPLLTWETTNTKEAGLDIGLFNNRLNITLDYYQKVTSGLLYNKPLPLASGFGSVLYNVGSVSNKGIETEISSINISNKNFQWSSNFNISFNRNKVIALGTTNAPISNVTEGSFSTQRLMVGQPVSVFWGYRQAGVFKDAADVAAHPENRLTTNGVLVGGPGDYKIQDTNGDGKITVDDQTVLGDPAPKFTYGFSNSINYKSFSLDVLMQGVYGNKIEFLTARFIGGANLAWNTSEEFVLNRWKSAAEPGNGLYGRTSGGGALAVVGQNETQSDRWLRNGSYLRCRNVTLGYKLPNSIAKRLAMTSLRVFCSAENLFTLTNYIGYNPDLSEYGEGVNTPGVDYATYPLSRTFSFGFKMGL
ncbi:MAG: TonB-dependent receptor [Bacteroidota bacterium]